MLAILVVMAVSMATVAIKSSNRSIALEQLRAANLVAVSLSRAAELALAVRDETELKRLATAFLLHDSLISVRIADQRDATLAVAVRTAGGDSAGAAGGGVADGPMAGCLLGHADVMLSAEDANGQVREAKRIGNVTVGLSTASLRAAQQHQAGVIVMAALVALLVTGGVVFVAAGRWSRRLLDLVAASDGITSGELDVPLCGHGRDEIGRLGASFEKMRSSLRERDRTLLELNNGLQDQVRVRTGALENALHAAEAATRAKTDFLANMSHEIRTPMTAILGFADLLAAPDCPLEERDEHVRTIKRNGEHLLVIINDILDISKMEAGKMTAHLTPCKPMQIIEEIRGLLALKASESGIALRVEFPGGPLPNWVISEPTRLRQILTNLVANAVKFTKVGTVTISATIVDAGMASQGLCFQVIDTGAGMDAEQVSRLFLPFSQVDNSASRVHGGTGLGLAISRGLAKMLGGGITVSSDPGKGSVFTVNILAPGCPAPTGFVERRQPCGDLARSCREAETVAIERRGGGSITFGNAGLGDAGLSAVGPCAPDAGGAAIWASTGRAGATSNGMRVILAEDGIDNQRLIALHLRRAGFMVEVVENGRLALDAITASPGDFDVLISDMQMPVMDGYTAVRTLRAQGYLGPVLALTAHAMNGDRERCLEAGCDDYATKPIQPAELISKVLAMAKVSRLIASGLRKPRRY